MNRAHAASIPAVVGLALIALTSVIGPPVAGAADTGPAAVARKVKAENQDAIIWVSAVMKTQMSVRGAQMERSADQKVETLGTAIDPRGLTVVSLSMLDPVSMYGESMFGGEDSDASEEGKFEMKSDLSDVKIRLADGTEIPAKLVLKDPDLDLAFIRPDKVEGKPQPKFTFVKLAELPEPQPLDELVFLGRLGKSLDRQVSVELGRVTAIVKKPRTFICVDTVSRFGAPVFDLEGRALGIGLMRRPTRGSENADMMEMFMGSSSLTPVVLPAKDVLEIAQQALKAEPLPQAGEKEGGKKDAVTSGTLRTTEKGKTKPDDTKKPEEPKKP
jgi:hypothetical protein